MEEDSRKHIGWGTGCFAGCGCLFFVVAIIIIILCFAGSCGMEAAASLESVRTSSQYDPQSLEEEYVGGDSCAESKLFAKIAIIDVHGVIVSEVENNYGSVACSKEICLRIRRAAEDPKVKALIIDLNTPGGEVTAADEIYDALLRVRAIHKKPVIAMMNSMAASGGYYVAAACNPIIANKNVLTGSIGVIISTYNYHGLFQKLGIQSEVYTSGRMKDMLNGARPRTPLEIQVVQKLVNDCYSDFVAIVSKARGIPEDHIRNSEIGDGRIFDGRQALQLKLVDRLGYFRDAVQTAKMAAHVEKKPCMLIRYNESFRFSKFFSMLFSHAKPVKLSLDGQSEFTPKRGVLYYLPAGY